MGEEVSGPIVLFYEFLWNKVLLQRFCKTLYTFIAREQTARGLSKRLYIDKHYTIQWLTTKSAAYSSRS